MKLQLMRLGLIAILMASFVTPPAVMAQSNSPDTSPEPTATNLQAASDSLDELVEETLASMSVADRVGQLFLITFDGNDVGFDSDIAELIYGYRVGGIVLDPRNGNYSNGKGVDTPSEVATLVNRLQALAYGVLLPEEDALKPLPDQWYEDKSLLLQDMTEVAPVNLPLFIGVTQSGDNLPQTTLRRGFTPLPSQMAIGAAWNAELAQEIGRIVGEELQAVGVNMLLGPNLDVLDQPQPDPVGRLGIHMFGGDPYWVGRMGQAYISGIHAGSQERLAAVAGHFPGAGDIDRLPEEEVSTVQRPLAELEQVALPPFRAVTQQSPDAVESGEPSHIADGMMSSLARYSAFQGSSLGRNTPIGLAPELEMVLDQHGFNDWRDRGGILVSGELGAPAIRRHYALSPTEFPFRRIALDAFTAGHDLLYLGRFSSDDGWESQRMHIKETIGFFQERYVEDPDFAQEVDERVRRILKLKLRLYGANEAPRDVADDVSDEVTSMAPIALESVLIQESGLTRLAEGRNAALAVVSKVAREAVGVLYPNPQEANEVLSRIPQKGEKILIFTDSRLQQECEDCTVEAAVGPDEIENIILKLYGPGATDQLAGDEITSRTFADLEELLDAEVEADAVQAPAVIPTVTPAPTQELPAEPSGTEQVESDTVAPPPAPEAIEDDGMDKNSRTSKLIDEADWIIFAMLDVDEELYPHSDALNRFLRLHSDDLASKYVVVFALNAPYFLDATEISKLNGYYGVYSKTQPFLEDAVRALFRSFPPDAAPPVSVVGTRFSSLSERLTPDPEQTIDLVLTDTDETFAVTQTTNRDEAPVIIDADTILRLQAGPVVDRNGNPVGDGEIVQFQIAVDGDESAQWTDQAPTRAGLAVKEVRVERGGITEVVARAGAASSGEPLRVSVQRDTPVVAEATSATVPAMAATGVATNAVPVEAVAMVDSSAASVGELALAEPALAVEGPAPISLSSLFIALLTIMVMVSMLVIVQVRVMPRRTLVHSILWAVNCGLIAYILYGYGLFPGAEWLQTSLNIFGSAIVVFVAMLLPLLWLQLRTES